MHQINAHSFHIPVMGIGYTIDTPAKVAHFGISSVISLVDDILIENMREVYSKRYNYHFESITNKVQDFRSKRITAYLNMLDKLVNDRLESIKSSILKKGNEFAEYIDMLPDLSPIKQNFLKFNISKPDTNKLVEWAKKNLYAGSIDVNIMTKLDKETYSKKEKLPAEYNDAHAALRGFAQSTLQSSLILSAGMNPRLYSYMENFEDFYPNELGSFKKKIIIKVSDYRSALVQGKFFAKKGLWVSEYRIESGLNCGGHAFATEGNLLGPVLEEFKINRDELKDTTFKMLVTALESKGKTIPMNVPELSITAQGGVGTAAEHNFLIKNYGLNSVGWGTPFLLVPDAVSIDSHTQKLLSEAKENDLYLSNISPLGVPYNNLKNNTQDLIKQKRIAKGKPGSPCVKKFVALNKEFTEKVICTASRQYQELKIKELKSKSLAADAYKIEHEKIVEKSCICVGLGTSAMLVNDMDTKIVGPGVSICPGPNMAYFSKIVSLKEMIDHIYGKNNIISRTDRPNMFIKELKMYVDYFKTKISESIQPISARQSSQLDNFKQNLLDGIEYYRNIFSDFVQQSEGILALKELDILKSELILVTTE